MCSVTTNQYPGSVGEQYRKWFVLVGKCQTRAEIHLRWTAHWSTDAVPRSPAGLQYTTPGQYSETVRLVPRGQGIDIVRYGRWGVWLWEVWAVCSQIREVRRVIMGGVGGVWSDMGGFKVRGWGKMWKVRCGILDEMRWCQLWEVGHGRLSLGSRVLVKGCGRRGVRFELQYKNIQRNN